MLHRLTLAIALLLPTLAFGQGACIGSQALTSRLGFSNLAAVVPGATISVSPGPIYTDNTITAVLSTSPNTTADAFGNFVVCAAPSTQTITVSGPNMNTLSFKQTFAIQSNSNTTWTGTNTFSGPTSFTGTGNFTTLTSTNFSDVGPFQVTGSLFNVDASGDITMGPTLLANNTAINLAIAGATIVNGGVSGGNVTISGGNCSGICGGQSGGSVILSPGGNAGTLGDVVINQGVSPNGGTGFKHKRGVAGCATGASVGAACTTTVTWGTAFADANYTVSCSGDVITSGVPVNGGITAKVAASVTFQTVATTAAAAQYTNIECIAVHD